MPAIAFALPILPGQEEVIKRLGGEVSGSGSLRSSYEGSRRSLGITEEKVWLQQTSIGQMVVVYRETDDPQRARREMAASQDQFDSKFKHLIETAAPALNFSDQQPLPNKLLFEWSAG